VQITRLPIRPESLLGRSACIAERPI
jgi:hypothetical protein